MKNYIGGVILFDETIKQKTTLGPSIPELISQNKAIPGIKVDKGAKPLSGSLDETVTEGLDGLERDFLNIISLEQGLQNGELFIKLETNTHPLNVLNQTLML